MGRLFPAVVVTASLVLAGCGAGQVVVGHNAAERVPASQLNVKPQWVQPGGPMLRGIAPPQVAQVSGSTCYVASGQSSCSLVPCKEFVTPRVSSGLVLSAPVPGSRRCGSPPASIRAIPIAPLARTLIFPRQGTTSTRPR